MGITHEDILVNTDALCEIDISTRKIITKSKKSEFQQYDHNSERIGFAMERFNDGHDMSQCDRIAVKYLNVHPNDMYVVDDVAVSEDGTHITFTWLVSANATQEVGSLIFHINFRCWNDEGIITYNWSTHPCSTYSIFKGVPSMDSNPKDNYDFWAKYRSLVDGVIDDTEKVGDRLSLLTNDTSSLEERVDSLDVSVDNLSSAVPALVTKVTSIENSLPDLEFKVNALDRALDDDVVYAISKDVIKVEETMGKLIRVSPNIINPNSIIDGKFLAYDWNSSSSEDYVDTELGVVYADKFTDFKVGDVLYSNSGGRIVYYSESSDLVSANYSLIETTLDDGRRVFKHEIVSTNPFKLDGYKSYITLEGLWFVCKSDDYSGEIIAYGDDSYPPIDEAIAEVKEDLSTLKNANFFIPNNLYLIRDRCGIRKMNKQNVIVAHNPDDFYMCGNTHSIYTMSNDKWIKIMDDGSTSADSPKINDSRTGAKAYGLSNMRVNTISKSDIVNPSEIKNVLMIGDSFMDDGTLPCEIKNIVVNEFLVTNLNFVGHKVSDSAEIECNNCGVGGITLTDYNKTDNEDGRGSTTWSNPFLYDGVISFTSYMKQYAEGNTLDYCVIECGVNDMIALSKSPEETAEQLGILIDNIHNEYPECMILVCGQKYANDVQTVVNTYTWNTSVMCMNRLYQELCESDKYSSFCVYTDIGALFDSLYMVPHEYQSLYKGSDDTRLVVTDWLHPNTSGYYYIAEAIASALLYYLKT